MLIHQLLFRKTTFALVAAALGCGCMAAEVKAFQLLDTFQVAGQIVTVTQLDPISTRTSRITSCGQRVLYSTRNDGTLWVNLNGGTGRLDAGNCRNAGTRDRLRSGAPLRTPHEWLAVSRQHTQRRPAQHDRPERSERHASLVEQLRRQDARGPCGHG